MVAYGYAGGAYRPRKAPARRSVGTTSKPKLVGPVKKMATRVNRAGAPAPRPGVGAGAGPAAAPAARAARKPATFDSTYFDRIDLADRRQAQQLSQLDNDEADIKRDYGIDDPSSPFSRANGLKEAFLARQKSASAGLAAQGQLYSGTHENAISRTRKQEEQARYELRQSYDQAINAVGAAKAGVKFATEEERQQAFENWLARAPEGEDEALSEADIEGPNQLEAPSAAPSPHGGGGGNRQQKAEERMRINKQNKRKSAALVEREKRQTGRANAIKQSTGGGGGGSYGKPSGGGGGGKPKSYVKNGWFYREDSKRPGHYLRIRRASGH